MTATVETAPAPGAPRHRLVRRRTGRVVDVVQQWAVFVVLVVVWELATRAADSPFFPPPSTIAVKLWTTWFGGPVGHVFLSDLGVANLLPSVARMLGSWAIAVVVGVALGVALGRSRVAQDYLGPLFAFFRAIPPPVLAPVFLLLFNLGTPMQVATIVFGVIWPIILNSTDGARTIDPTQYETARSFRLPRRQWVLGVVLPAAMPKIFAGLRVSLSLALILMVISELLGATEGIGFQLSVAKGTFDFPGMWAIVVMLGVLGYLFNTILLTLERRVLRWQPGRK
jgi:ABC-type nitrate/sulfonate/bicarbonate transport system permease component